ncbi:MAG: ribosome silencing factor [Deltaproteobacteria bacterium]|nr:ribosome silencing factor [Deltaproteobacteria bacterium]
MTAVATQPLAAEALLEQAVKTIDAVKGLDPVALEVKGLCSFADYFLICSGTSRRHVLALAEHLEEALGKAGVKPLGVEGLQEGLWVLMDFNDLVIHIFSQPLREFYNLEGLWAEAPRLFMETGSPDSPSSLSGGSRPTTPEEGDQTRHE